MKEDISKHYKLPDDSLETLAWFIVEMNMQDILDVIIDKLIEGISDE